EGDPRAPRHAESEGASRRSSRCFLGSLGQVTLPPQPSLAQLPTSDGRADRLEQLTGRWLGGLTSATSRGSGDWPASAASTPGSAPPRVDRRTAGVPLWGTPHCDTSASGAPRVSIGSRFGHCDTSALGSRHGGTQRAARCLHPSFVRRPEPPAAARGGGG